MLKANLGPLCMPHPGLGWHGTPSLTSLPKDDEVSYEVSLPF